MRASGGLSTLACALMPPRLFDAVRTRSSVQFVGGVALAVDPCLRLRDRARVSSCMCRTRKPARRVLSCSRRAGLQYVLSEDGCALTGLLVGGERVRDSAGRGERVHLTVASLNAPERSVECVRRVHLLDGGHVHARINAPLCAFCVGRERRRHGLVGKRNVGRFVACQVAIDTVAVHALTVCVAELGRVDEWDAPRADLLAGHAHVLAVDVVADSVQVVSNIDAALVRQVSVQGLVDELGDTTVNDNGVTVLVIVGLTNSIGLIIGSHVERFVQLAGLAVPVRLVKIVGLRTVDRVVGDHVGVAPSAESRVPVAEVGEGGLDGLTARLVAVAGGLVADGDGAGGGSVVDELLLGGGGLLLHHDMYHLSVLVLSLVDVFYCSTNTTRLSTRVDKGAVVWVTLSPILPHWRGDRCGSPRACVVCGARGIDSVVPPCYYCVCWPRVRVVR